MGVIAPSKLVGARSPIYITANYSSVASSLTSVDLDLFIWNDAIGSRPSSATYTLIRDVFAGTDVSFDISEFVREYIENAHSGFDVTDISNVPDKSVWYVDIDFDVDYLDTQSTPVAQNDTGSTDTFEVSNGYHLYEEGANNEVSQGFVSIDAEKYIPLTGDDVVPVYLGKYQEGLDLYWAFKARVTTDSGTFEDDGSCGNFGLQEVRVIADNTSEVDFVVTEAELTGTQPEQRIITIPSGLTNVSAWHTSEGESFNYTDYFDIILRDKDGYNLGSRRFYPTCEPKYTPLHLRFINRNGVWESIHFFKSSQESIQTRTSEYHRALGSSSSAGFTYDTSLEQYKRYNTNYRNSVTCNTGFVGEDYKDVMTQLLASERVMLDGKPVNVVTNSLQLQKHINDNTINYTIELQYAYDTIYE